MGYSCYVYRDWAAIAKSKNSLVILIFPQCISFSLSIYFIVICGEQKFFFPGVHKYHKSNLQRHLRNGHYKTEHIK